MPLHMSSTLCTSVVVFTCFESHGLRLPLIRRQVEWTSEQQNWKRAGHNLHPLGSMRRLSSSMQQGVPKICKIFEKLSLYLKSAAGSQASMSKHEQFCLALLVRDGGQFATWIVQLAGMLHACPGNHAYRCHVDECFRSSQLPLHRKCRVSSIFMDSDWPLITSPANPRLKTIRRLQHGRRQRERLGLVLLEGRRLVLDALAAGLVPQYVVVHDAALDQEAEGEQLRHALSSAACDVIRAPAKLINDLSDTTSPQGVLAVLQQVELPVPPDPSFVLICDAVNDPGNLGTLLRSAAGAGVGLALLSPGCSDPWGLKVLRAGMGAQFRLPMRQLTWTESSAQLHAWGCAAYAADAGSELPYDLVDWSVPSALVVGSEAHGLSDDVKADSSVKHCCIPLGGSEGMESLNAAVAGSIILFEAQRQRRQQSKQG